MTSLRLKPIRLAHRANTHFRRTALFPLRAAYLDVAMTSVAYYCNGTNVWITNTTPLHNVTYSHYRHAANIRDIQ
jgi:hypothetical protein